MILAWVFFHFNTEINVHEDTCMWLTCVGIPNKFVRWLDRTPIACKYPSCEKGLTLSLSVSLSPLSCCQICVKHWRKSETKLISWVIFTVFFNANRTYYFAINIASLSYIGDYIYKYSKWMIYIVTWRITTT